MGPASMIDTGDTAWVLGAAALVLFMTPGLALFYGGPRPVEERARHDDAVGRRDRDRLRRVAAGRVHARVRPRRRRRDRRPRAPRVPRASARRRTRSRPPCRTRRSRSFQLMFAVITPALIAGAFAERVRFGGYVVVRRALVTRWSTRRSPTGSGAAGSSAPAGIGALDFAGGTVVHISAGAAALAAALFVGKRRGYPRGELRARTTSRWWSSARASSGSAGSGSTPGAPSAANGLASSALPRHAPRRRGRADRMARARADPPREGDGRRGSDRRRGGAGRDHAGRRVRGADGRAGDRPDRRSASASPRWS